MTKKVPTRMILAAIGVATCLATGLMAGPSALAATASFTPVPGSPFATGSVPFQVAFSPTGRLLATANLNDSTVSVFSVNASTGALTQVPGSPFATGGSPTSVAFSPSGSLVAVIGCVNVNHGNCFQSAVSVFSVDGSTGSLTPVPGSPFATAEGAEQVAFSPSGNLVATANNGEDGGGSVSVFSVDGSTGSLTPVAGSPFATGTDPFSLAFSPSGGLLATANTNENTVSLFSVNSSTGALTQEPGSPSADPGQPEQVAFSPSGALLATVDSNDFKVSMFSVAASTGALTEVSGSPFSDGIGPISLAFSPSGDLLATANQDGKAAVFSVAASTGSLTQIAGSPFATGSVAQSLAFSPSGDLLAIANAPASAPGSVTMLRYATVSPSAALSQSLALSRSATNISTLLRAGRESLPVTVPAAGREQITWEYRVPHPRRGQNPEVAVASGSKAFKGPASATLVIRLTGAGRALLKHASRISLTAVGTFTPQHGGHRVTAHRGIELRRLGARG